jgi:hypothetical protein
MLSAYTLEPTKIHYDLLDHFPKCQDGKVGIFLSGGMESTLLGKIALELYGKDRVLFFYSDWIFCGNDPTYRRYVQGNVDNGAKILGIDVIYVDINYNTHHTDRQTSFDRTIEFLKEQYTVEFVLWGFTKLFFDVEDFKRLDNPTVTDIQALCYSDPVKYRSVIEEFHVPTNLYTETIAKIDIPLDVYHLLRQTNSFIKSPFKDLNKCEVVDLYRQMGILDLVYQTRSCMGEELTDTSQHCGQCFNCQQRWDAFDILGVPDLTPYVRDTVKYTREKLLNEINS